MRNKLITQNIPIILCVYKRTKRLSQTLKQLEGQTYKNIDIYIWNNSIEDKKIVDDIVSNYPNLKINVFHSTQNIGGFGRFYKAKEISNKYNSVIFIDDDIDYSMNFVETLEKEFKQKTIHSFYAFKFRSSSNYFDRNNILTNQEADYCGTGGMICDIEIFQNNGLFNCPKKFWFIEDLWLSYYASDVLGWKLYKSSAKINRFNDDGLDQWRELSNTKSVFLQYLIENKNWEVPTYKNYYEKITSRMVSVYVTVKELLMKLFSKFLDLH